MNKTVPAPETNNKQINQYICDIGWFSVLWRKTTQAKEGRERRTLWFIAVRQGAGTGGACSKGKGWQSDRRAQGLEVGVLEPSRAKSLKEGRGRKPAESGTV